MLQEERSQLRVVVFGHRAGDIQSSNGNIGDNWRIVLARDGDFERWVVDVLKHLGVDFDHLEHMKLFKSFEFGYNEDEWDRALNQGWACIPFSWKTSAFVELFLVCKVRLALLIDAWRSRFSASVSSNRVSRNLSCSVTSSTSAFSEAISMLNQVLVVAPYRMRRRWLTSVHRSGPSIHSRMPGHKLRSPRLRLAPSRVPPGGLHTRAPGLAIL